LVGWHFIIENAPEYINFIVERLQSIPEFRMLGLELSKVYCMTNILWKSPVGFILPVLEFNLITIDLVLILILHQLQLRNSLRIKLKLRIFVLLKILDIHVEL
jgi:hypothetical protein